MKEAYRLKNVLILQVMEERKRWFLWVPIFFSVGVGLYFSFSWQPQVLHMGHSVLIMIFLFLPFVKNRQILLLPVISSLIISLGFNAALIRQHSIAAPVLQKKAVTQVSGLVAYKSVGTKKKRLLLEDLDFENVKVPELTKVRITVRTDISHVLPGQRITLKAVLLPPPAPAYPGAYDFQRDSYFKQIGAVGYSISDVEIIETNTGYWHSFLNQSSVIRDQINTYIKRNAPEEVAGFSIAIMSGDKAALNKNQLDDMRQAGLAHLLAISGLHMGMVGGLIFFTVRLLGSLWPRVALTYPIKKWAAVIALAGLTGYLLVSGMSISALRAYLMISMVFIAICFDRTALSLRNLALAALIILLIFPESLLSVSFQMSFAAVFCLIAAYERFGTRALTVMHKSGFIKRGIIYFTGIMFTSLIASFATAPFAVFHFGQFALLGIIANLVAVPLMGLWVMPWTLVSFILMPFIETSITLDLAGEGISIILTVAQYVASLPGSILQIGVYPQALLVGLVFSVLWFLIWRNRLKWGAAVFLAIGIISLSFESIPDILFNDSGNLFLVRQSDTDIYVSTMRADRFERKRWQLLYGSTELQKIPTVYKEGEAIRCDEVGCVFRKDAHIVAFANNWMASDVDCERADILFSSEPVYGECATPKYIIDKFDLWRSGTHALYFKKDGTIYIETVNSVRGDRPWVPVRYRINQHNSGTE